MGSDVTGLGSSPMITGAASDIYDTLSSPRRMDLIETLITGPTPMSVESLATSVAARYGSKAEEDVSDEERHAVQVSLHHHHLPKLEAKRFIAWDREAGTVSLPESFPVTRAEFEALLDAHRQESAQEFEPVLEQPRRQVAMSVISNADEPLSAERLARSVVAFEHRSEPEQVSTQAADRVCVSLYHSHLPALANAGLVEFDAEEGIVNSID